MIPPNIAIGDTLIIREGSGQQRRYCVNERNGTVALELLLVGVNGARRKLIEADGKAMLVRALSDGRTEGRRVTQVVIERQVGEDEDGEPLVVRSSSEPKPLDRIDAIELARLINCMTVEQLASWVIDREIRSAIVDGDQRAHATVKAMRLFMQSREIVR